MKFYFENGIFKIPFENIEIFITTKLWNNDYPFSYKIYSLKQVHSNKIIEVKRDMFLKEEGDGLFTFEKNIILEVKIADCFPVFIFDKNLIMVLHVGWKGAKEGIVQKGIEIFKEKGDFKNIKVFLGPGIKKCCYEIKEDVANFFKDFLEKRDERIYLDLEKFIINNFLKEGIKKEKIFIFPYCTSCRNDIFYSNRKKDKGRNRGWIIKLF
ncbi:MAG: polyphenol oxidase family protein [candidate division WOR-3 bacterium]